MVLLASFNRSLALRALRLFLCTSLLRVVSQRLSLIKLIRFLRLALLVPADGFIFSKVAFSFC